MIPHVDPCLSLSPLAPTQAISAIQTLNEVELDGRPLQVREDRLDRDVAQFNGEQVGVGGESEGNDGSPARAQDVG